MKRIAYSASIIALAAFTLGAGAQNSSSYGVAGMETMNSKTTVVVARPSACPVSLRALQGAGYGPLHVRGAQATDVPAQRIHLIIARGEAESTRRAGGGDRAVGEESHEEIFPGQEASPT